MDELREAKETSVDGFLKNSSFSILLEGWPATVSVCAVCITAVVWMCFDYKKCSFV